MNFDGIHCPKCRRMVKRKGNGFSCRCGWHYVEPESNWVKRFIYGW